jgi:hypothetical protein
MNLLNKSLRNINSTGIYTSKKAGTWKLPVNYSGMDGKQILINIIQSMNV